MSDETPDKPIVSDATRAAFLLAAEAMNRLALLAHADAGVATEVAAKINEWQQNLSTCDWPILGYDTSEPPADNPASVKSPPVLAQGDAVVIDGRIYTLDSVGTQRAELRIRQATATCKHCGRSITHENGAWVDRNATGDDAVWRETCDSHDTFTAEHEPDTTPPAEPGTYVKGDERVAVTPEGQIGNDEGTFAQFPTVDKAVTYLTNVGYRRDSETDTWWDGSALRRPNHPVLDAIAGALSDPKYPATEAMAIGRALDEAGYTIVPKEGLEPPELFRTLQDAVKEDE